MNKILVTLFFIGYFALNNQCYCQLSVYVSQVDGIYGWSVDSTNKQFQRHKKAEEDCIKKGGKDPQLQFEGDDNDMTGQNSQYGCYAFIFGIDSKGKRHYGMAHMRKTKEEALQIAKWRISKDVDPENIVIILNDCFEKRVSKNVQQTPQNNGNTWSVWISDSCYPGIQYRYFGKKILNLNEQYHMSFEIRNTYNMNTFFDFALYDQYGYRAFGDRHNITPGQTISFIHKMKYDIIRKFNIEKFCFQEESYYNISCLLVHTDATVQFFRMDKAGPIVKLIIRNDGIDWYPYLDKPDHTFYKKISNDTYLYERRDFSPTDFYFRLIGEDKMENWSVFNGKKSNEAYNGKFTRIIENK